MTPYLIDDDLTLGGVFLRIVPSRNQYYIIDDEGKVLSIKDKLDQAIEEAKVGWSYPDVVYHNGSVYVGNIFEMKPDDDLGFIICKGAEVLYSYKDKREALERFRSL